MTRPIHSRLLHGLFVAAMAFLYVLAGLQTPPAAAQSDSSRHDIDAVTTALVDLRLAFTIPGKVLTVHVKKGDLVKAQDVIMELDHREQSARVEIREMQADSDLAIKQAELQFELEKIRFENIADLRKKGGASEFEFQTAQAQVNVAELNLEAEKQRREQAALLLKQEKATLDRFFLYAPVDGVLDAMIVHEGETVNELDPVVNLVVTDPLKVDAAVPTEATLGLKPGDPAWIQSKLHGFGNPLRGKVERIAVKADAASATRLVEIHVPNHVGLPPGDHVVVTFAEPRDNDNSHVGETRNLENIHERLSKTD